MSGGIFISYRRQDASDLAGRLYDRLVDRFGQAWVFMDVNTIEPGVNFTESISRGVHACEVLLVVMGPQWLTATDRDGRRRLDDPDDVVRLEIEAALAREVRVIPILVRGAEMPQREQLPESLAGLARRNALNMRHDSFSYDVERLFAAIERVLGTGRSRGVQQAAAIRLLFLAADPWDTARSRLDKEIRYISEQLRLSKQRDRFDLAQRWSVRSVDVTEALLEFRPQIVHFSGRGTPDGALCFEDEAGRISPAEPRELARMFAVVTDRVSCVVLNACFSGAQAKAIAEQVDHVIGMSDALDDQAALAFMVGFYQAAGAGRSFEEAYNLGCMQIGLRGLPSELTPVLLRRR